MAALTISKIFSNTWFWFGLMAVVVIIHYFWGKTPPPPKPSKFLEKHKKTITKVTDTFLISVVLFGWVPSIFMFVIEIKPLWDPRYKFLPPTETLRGAFAFFLICATYASGLSGILIGMLSTFHSGLTKVKRIFLIVISFLPLAFTILFFLTVPKEKPEDFWPMFKLGLGGFISCWIINGPAIILGKHFLPVAWNILRRLRWVSGEYPR